LRTTTVLRPLVAVRPVYLPPYTAAKTIASLAHLCGRAVDVNLVTGGSRTEVRALGDETSHGERYSRTIEYATILQRLILGGAPVTFEGRHYRVSNLRLEPDVPKELRPRLFISGSSPAGRDAARSVGAVAVRYPQRPDEEDEAELRANGLQHGIRVGIIAREDADDAWAVARSRFPDDGGHALDLHWLHPSKRYRTFCPYLVGSYDQVATEVGRYLDLGVGTIITDVPSDPVDLHDARRVIDQALSLALA
jgi:alkanesulfonate monooxygenase